MDTLVPALGAVVLLIVGCLIIKAIVFLTTGLLT